MTVSAEALRISGLHAPIVRKIAFMKLHLHRGVIYFFPFSVLIVSCRLILSQWAVILGVIYNSQLHLLLPFASHFLIKTFKKTQVHKPDLFHIRPERQTWRQLCWDVRCVFALVTHIQISQTHVPDTSTEITVMSRDVFRVTDPVLSQRKLVL